MITANHDLLFFSMFSQAKNDVGNIFARICGATSSKIFCYLFDSSHNTFVNLSVGLFSRMTVWLFVCLSVVCLSIGSTVYLSVGLSDCLDLWMRRPVCSNVCMYSWLSISPSVGISGWLSVCLTILSAGLSLAVAISSSFRSVLHPPASLLTFAEPVEIISAQTCLLCP